MHNRDTTTIYASDNGFCKSLLLVFHDYHFLQVHCTMKTMTVPTKISATQHTLNCSPGMADIAIVTPLGNSFGIQSLSPAP